LMRWDGARTPVIWSVDPPSLDAAAARLELARRYLHVFGPSNAAAFSDWAGVRLARADKAFSDLATEISPVRSPIGPSWILASDEQSFRAPPSPGQGVRLLPSGDTWFLLQGSDRALLVPDPVRRSQLWTPRVWPGALLIDGDVSGIWRRANATVTISPWRPLSTAERQDVEAEAASFPLPDLRRPVQVPWE